MPETPDRVKQERLRDRTRLTNLNVGADRAGNVFVPNQPDQRPGRAINLSSLSPTLGRIMEDLNEAENIEAETEAREKVSKLLNSNKWADLVDQGVPYSANPIAREVIQDAIARRGAREYASRVEARIKSIRDEVVNGTPVGDIEEAVRAIQADELSKFEGEFGALIGVSKFQRARFGELLAGNDRSQGVNNSLLEKAKVEISTAQDQAGEAAVRAAYFEDGLLGFQNSHADSNGNPDMMRVEPVVIEEMQRRAAAVAQSFGYVAGPKVVAESLNDLATHLRNIESRNGEPLYTEDQIEAYIHDLAEGIRLPIPLAAAGQGGSRKKEALINHPVAGPIITQTLNRLGDSAARGTSARSTRRKRQVEVAMLDTSAARRELVRLHAKDPSTFDLEKSLEKILAPYADGDANLMADMISDARDQHARRIERDAGINRAEAQRALQGGILNIKAAPTRESALIAYNTLMTIPGIDIDALDTALARRVSTLSGAGHLPGKKSIDERVESLIDALPVYTKDGQVENQTVALQVRGKIADRLADIVEKGGDDAAVSVALGEFLESEALAKILAPLEERRTSLITNRNALKSAAEADARRGVENAEAMKQMAAQGLASSDELDSISRKARENADLETWRSNQARGLKSRMFSVIEGILKTDDGRTTLSGLVAAGEDPSTLAPRTPDVASGEILLLKADTLFERWMGEVQTEILNDASIPDALRQKAFVDRMQARTLEFLGEFAGEDFSDYTPASRQQEADVIRRVRDSARALSESDRVEGEEPVPELLSRAGLSEEEKALAALSAEEQKSLSNAQAEFNRTKKILDGDGHLSIPIPTETFESWRDSLPVRVETFRGGQGRRVYDIPAIHSPSLSGGISRLGGLEEYANLAVDTTVPAHLRAGYRSIFGRMLRDSKAGKLKLDDKGQSSLLTIVGADFDSWLDKKPLNPRGLDGESRIWSEEDAKEADRSGQATIAGIAEASGHRWDKKLNTWTRVGGSEKADDFVLGPVRQSKIVRKLTEQFRKESEDRQFAREGLTYDSSLVLPMTTPMFRDEAAFKAARGDKRKNARLAKELGVKPEDPLVRQFWYNQELLLRLRKE